jgi:hypothetical protein
VVKEPRYFSIWERTERERRGHEPGQCPLHPPPPVTGVWRQPERWVPVSGCVEDSQGLLGSRVQRGSLEEWPVTGRMEVH